MSQTCAKSKNAYADKKVIIRRKTKIMEGDDKRATFWNHDYKVG